MRQFTHNYLFTVFLGASLGFGGIDCLVRNTEQLLGRSPELRLSAYACQPPALARLRQHQIAPGETLDSIARRYNLIPATLMGLNPVLQTGQAPVGAVILIPPYNGVRVEVPANQTLRDVAKTYSVRLDVLFEVNGCQANPRVVFVPGVNWSPLEAAAASTSSAIAQVIGGYPLPPAFADATLLMGYGWKLQPRLGQVAFHSGVDLAAPVGTDVLAAGSGTVAFVGNQGSYGNLIVINHAQGLQTRYGQLSAIRVQVGQGVQQGQVIGAVGVSGIPSSERPHLHFELRSRSNLGWVAENPEPYLKRILARTE
jgi:lysostaphin